MTQFVKWQLKKHPRLNCALVFKMYHNHFVINSTACEVCVFANHRAFCGSLLESRKLTNQVDLYFNEVYKTTWPKSLVVQMTITGCSRFGTHDGRIFYDELTQSYKGEIDAAYTELDEEGQSVTTSYTFAVELKDPFVATVHFVDEDKDYFLEDTTIFNCKTPHFEYIPVKAEGICSNPNTTLKLEIKK